MLAICSCHVPAVNYSSILNYSIFEQNIENISMNRVCASTLRNLFIKCSLRYAIVNEDISHSIGQYHQNQFLRIPILFGNSVLYLPLNHLDDSFHANITYPILLSPNHISTKMHFLLPEHTNFFDFTQNNANISFLTNDIISVIAFFSFMFILFSSKIIFFSTKSSIGDICYKENPNFELILFTVVLFFTCASEVFVKQQECSQFRI